MIVLVRQENTNVRGYWTFIIDINLSEGRYTDILDVGKINKEDIRIFLSLERRHMDIFNIFI